MTSVVAVKVLFDPLIPLIEIHVGVKTLGDIAVPNVDARTGEQNSICEGQLKFAGRLEAIPSCPDGPLIRNQAT